MNKHVIKRLEKFLDRRGVWTMFCGLYKQYRYLDNPKNIDEYLRVTPARLVISYAFDTTRIKGGNFGAGYWNKIHQEWIEIIEKYNLDNAGSSDTVAKEEDCEIESNIETLTPLSVLHDWAGLDLPPIPSKVRTPERQPKGQEFRVWTKNGNNVLLSKHFSDMLTINGTMLDSMVMTLSMPISFVSTECSIMAQRQVSPVW